MSHQAEGFLQRLDAVSTRLKVLVDAEPREGALTELDPRRNERWEWGQAWAHTAEFPDYWVGQIEGIIAGGDLSPFGRVQSDPARLAAIEADRGTPTREIWSRLAPSLGRVRALIEGMTADQWLLRGSHPVLGERPMPEIVEEFLVGHLESHAEQLEKLLRAS